MTKKLALSTAAVLLLLAPLAMAPAQAAVQVGTLTCTIEPGVGFIVGSSKDVECAFRSARGYDEHYNGTVTKIGVDIGFTTGGRMVWAVVAPSTDLEPGVLEGRYAGATAGATVGVGVGANVLVGGFDKSITLQPLSVEGNKGLNVAAGIGALNLRHG